MMHLYLISRSDLIDYDEYNAMIVCANNPEMAIQLTFDKQSFPDEWQNYKASFVVKSIGIASEDMNLGVVLASYNSG